MSEFVTLECKYCGNADRGTFTVRENEYICRCCGRAYRKKLSDGEARCAQGFENLKNYSFEAAEDVFADVISEYPDSVDARWGLLLARYGIVFVKGFYTDEVEPIYCFPNYSYSSGAFREEPEYGEIEKLLKNDAERLSLYQKQAQEIEAAFAAFRSDVGKKKNDVFICVKISKTTANNPNAKGTTEDYEKACELYDKLTKAGKRVFFSYVTLKNTVDSDMAIWRNMLKSKKMLLIGSRAEYLGSVWVKSEWERWLWLDSDGRNEHKKNLYIYILGGEDENLYAKLPAGLKKLNPQIYTQAAEADLINDICYGDKPAKKPKPEQPQEKEIKPEPKPEKQPKPEKAPKGKAGYIELLDGSREKLAFGASVNFAGRSDIVSIMLPESVTEVSGDMLKGCQNLEAVYLPGTLKKIGQFAFAGCRKLASVKIPRGVTEIGAHAFEGCEKLASLKIPSGVSEIAEETFYGCKGLTSVELPEGLRIIGRKAFSHCTSMKKIELPRTLAVIGDSAFHTSGLRNLSVPRAVLKVGIFAFAYCHKLRKIEFCDTVEYIGNGAFDFDTNAKIFYEGDNGSFYRVYEGSVLSYDKLICGSNVTKKRARAKAAFNVFLLLAIIVAAVAVAVCVPGSLHWVIAIAGGIVLNVAGCMLSMKFGAEVQATINGIELFAFVLLLIAAVTYDVALIYGLGLVIGACIGLLYLYTARPELGVAYLMLDIPVLAAAIFALISGAEVVLWTIAVMAVLGFIGYIIYAIFDG